MYLYISQLFFRCLQQEGWPFFYKNFLFYIGVELIRASLIAQLVKNLPAMQETPV